MTEPTGPAPGRRFSALVLAASRGPDDPMAKATGVAHKCLVRTAGVPMLCRVLDALAASASVARIAISIDDPAVLESAPIADAMIGREVTVLRSAATASRSVLAAAAALADPFPLLVTTADSALLDGATVDLFCREALAGGAKLAAGLAPAAVILRDYPAAKRTFLKFRDDGYSGCNLFALTEPAALDAVRFWAGIERHRKRPWKLVGAFGPVSLLLFLARRLSLDDAMARASKVLGVPVAAVKIPIAEAAMDVDKPADLILVEEILARRAAAH